MLRYPARLENIELKKYSVPKILEKGESFDTHDSDGDDHHEPESSDSEEKREKSIQRLRGILKRKMTAGSIVRSIKFSMEDQDKLKNNLKHFDKKSKKKLRSPPPKEPSPILLSQQPSAKFLVHSASFYTFKKSKEDIRKTASSPNPAIIMQGAYSDSENSEDDNAVLMSKHVKSRYAKLRLDTDGYGSIHKGAYEYELEQAFDNIEKDAKDEIITKGKVSRESSFFLKTF
jgi:hypothetical protein